jgi:hypothetical protein
MSPLRATVLSTALLSPLQIFFPLRPSVSSSDFFSSEALCPLYGPLKNSGKSKTTSLITRNFLQNAFRQNSKGCCDLFRISDDRDNHDYHLSEILSDNRSGEKSCDNHDNHSQQEAIRISRKIENAISYQP